MRKLLSLFALFAILLTSCADNETSHETEWSEGGKDSVVHVRYYDNNQNKFFDYYIGYIMFNSLYGRGGYQSVHNYYQANPNQFHNQTGYRGYSSNYNPRPATASSSSTSSSSSYTSPSRSSSSPSRSYSSPSRSYSSPSRSYSSPSRSYSSPSRSYSSPSRH